MMRRGTGLVGLVRETVHKKCPMIISSIGWEAHTCTCTTGACRNANANAIRPEVYYKKAAYA